MGSVYGTGEQIGGTTATITSFYYNNVLASSWDTTNAGVTSDSFGQNLYLDLYIYSPNNEAFNYQYLVHATAIPETDSVILGGAQNTAARGGTGYASYTVGAPEIDGSLAPKVGFLLGCLFLMFGRKKQNTESMLTA